MPNDDIVIDTPLARKQRRGRRIDPMKTRVWYTEHLRRDGDEWLVSLTIFVAFPSGRSRSSDWPRTGEPLRFKTEIEAKAGGGRLFEQSYREAARLALEGD